MRLYLILETTTSHKSLRIYRDIKRLLSPDSIPRIGNAHSQLNNDGLTCVPLRVCEANSAVLQDNYKNKDYPKAKRGYAVSWIVYKFLYFFRHYGEKTEKRTMRKAVFSLGKLPHFAESCFFSGQTSAFCGKLFFFWTSFRILRKAVFSLGGLPQNAESYFSSIYS